MTRTPEFPPLHATPENARPASGRFICPNGNYYEVTIRWTYFTLYGPPICPCSNGDCTDMHRMIFLN